MRCTVNPRVAFIHPGMICLIPAYGANLYVIGHISSWEHSKAPPNEKPEDIATTKMDIYIDGKKQGTFRVPNSAMLCYVDHRMLEPPFKSLVPPDDSPKDFDSTWYYRLCGSLPIKRKSDNP
ncbi:MAG: hypothetical protein E6R03_10810 [Hyphomicrobiaceae bacterium]|nr:MAG: hypothetical protein E6R03_10810 [Hyphomicrobiaceae bacterium]